MGGFCAGATLETLCLQLHFHEEKDSMLPMSELNLTIPFLVLEGMVFFG